MARTDFIMDRPALKVYAIYYNPSDYPGKFVLRIWNNDVPEKKCIVKKTLSEIHNKLPMNLFNLGSDPVDKTIIEVWI